MSNKTTDFGYKKVNIEEKAGKVAEVFHSVAGNYDLMNDLMSGGIHRLWKRVTIEMSGVRSGHTVLDLAGGTGDLAAKFSRIVGPEGTVVLADINDSMLKVGRDRLVDGFGLYSLCGRAPVSADRISSSGRLHRCASAR